MRSFIFSLLKFALILLVFSYAISNLIYSVDSDHYWEYETPLLHQKYLDFQPQSDAIDVVFIGSSKFYRQIDPLIFDSVVSGNISSYNLSVPNFFPVRSYNFVQRFSNENKNVKTIFIELSPIARIGKNYGANPNINAIDNRTFVDVISFCTSTHYPLVYKMGYFTEYAVLYLYKYLGFGVNKYLHTILFETESAIAPLNKTIEASKGYYSFEDQLREKKTKTLINRQNEFADNSVAILKKAVKENSESGATYSASTDNISYRLKKLATDLRQQGVEVIFLIPPRQKKVHLNYLREQKLLLNDFPIIDLSSPTEYAAFYTKENSFDRSHLNNRGSSVMSVEVANAYLKLKGKSSE
ncbi:MAG: hypothetical protein JKX84_08835 [Flavobacteriales bacterium]|nr:hypothetical protein [Flavobacteriales bacterium]